MLKLKIILGFLILASTCLADEPYTLEKIVVKSGGAESTQSLRSNYSFQSISASEIKENNLACLADILDYIAGMDLRYRGTFGIQGDLSLRGSTYEQVAVLVDGVKINDPQTGHHNLDIPLTTFDVERVDVIKEGDSSLYGAGALAGSVNIITRKPARNSLNIDTLFGENALFGQTASLSILRGTFSGRVSFDHKISKAARPNTDFEYETASLYLNKDMDKLSCDALFGYQKKDFGADSFYSNNFPEEEEHTQTFFFKSGVNPKLNFGSFKNNLFLRVHNDKFILQRNNPTSVNYHTTYLYGVNSELNLPFRYGDILLGIDLGNEEINSTNLGKHQRLYEAGSLGFIPKLTDRFSAALRFRVDNYQKWGAQESHNLSLGYELIKDTLKIKGSLGRSFRIPSFTDLFYSDAANKGDPNLKVEQSDNLQVGADFRKGIVDLGIDFFLRRGSNLIDYTRTQETDPWQATNLGRIDFQGIEFYSQIRPNINYKGAQIKKIAFSYNYTSADRKASGFFSKYALDILQHQYLLDISSELFSLNFDWHLSYSQRYYSQSYFVGNINISKKIKFGDYAFEPFVRVDNFTNKKYSEIQGVLLPGRWIKGGVKFEW